MTKAEFIKRAIKKGVSGNANIYHDFLSGFTQYNDSIKETATYFFKLYPAAGNKEIRYHKKSTRVSVSKHETPQKNITFE